MQIMLENSFAPIKSGPGGEYTIKKKRIDSLDNSSHLEQKEIIDNQKNSSVNAKRTPTNKLNEEEFNAHQPSRKNPPNNPKPQMKKLKVDEKQDFIPPPPSTINHPISSDTINNKVGQQIKKAGSDTQGPFNSGRSPRTGEYISYSQKPKTIKTSNINQETFLHNRLKMVPHIKLKESKFGNIFIPVLPSSLTDAGNF